MTYRPFSFQSCMHGITLLPENLMSFRSTAFSPRARSSKEQQAYYRAGAAAGGQAHNMRCGPRRAFIWFSSLVGAILLFAWAKSDFERLVLRLAIGSGAVALLAACIAAPAVRLR